MSVVTGLALTMILSLVLVAFIVYQIGKIVRGRVQELDQVIKTLERDKAISNELKQIKGFEVTIENKLNKIEKVIVEADNNNNDL